MFFCTVRVWSAANCRDSEHACEQADIVAGRGGRDEDQDDVRDVQLPDRQQPHACPKLCSWLVAVQPAA